MALERKPTETRTVRWITPPEIPNALGPFDLDPCQDTEQVFTHARNHYTIEDDGLYKPWNGRVWLNPPYGKHTEVWLERMAQHNNGIAFLFARTDTRMFQRFVWPVASAFLFMAGRPHFYRPNGTQAKGNSGGPMVLAAYGEGNAAMLGMSRIPGWYLRNHGRRLT